MKISADIPVNPHRQVSGHQVSGHRLSGQTRFKMVLTGVVLPAFALALSMDGPPVGWSHWQSGEVSQYVAMLLAWPGYAAFLPLILFSMVALLVWIWRDQMLQHFIVRLGLYTGVILTVQFNVLILVAEPDAAGFLLIMAAVFLIGQAAVLFGLSFLIRSARRFSIRYLLIITTVVAIAIAFIQACDGGAEFLNFVTGVPVLGAIAAPVLSAITMARAAIRAFAVGQSRSFKMSDLPVWGVALGWLGWVTGFVVAWRIAVEVMLVEYSKLPVTRPGCYVASAAAHGHPGWVGSQWVDGISMPVNAQLRRLKFLEFVIKAASPRLHCHARIMYDRFGPKLAALCRRSRWFSDIAYLFLLLPESVAVLVRVLFRFPADRVDNLYRKPV